MTLTAIINGEEIILSSEEESAIRANWEVHVAPTVEDYRVAIQNRVDEVARAKLYDSAVSFASYIASTDPIWSSEAQRFVAWRDAVWNYTYTQLHLVSEGYREAPTVEGFIAELPAIEWP